MQDPTQPPSESLTPVRDFNLWSAFALAFSDISPIVGIYSVFAIGLASAGPAFWWAFPVVLAGQLMVTGVFGDLVSRWPFQGSVYAWSKELLGARYGWFTNWAYSWGLTIAVTSVALAAAGFLAPAIGITSPSGIETSLLALLIVLLGTGANMIGARVLRWLLYLTMSVEVIASLGIGVVILFFHRIHPFTLLLSGAGTGSGSGWLFGPFLGVVAITGFSFLGFEAAGSIAEEVTASRRVLPKAIRLSLAAAGVLVMFAAMSLVLSVPDIGQVLAGKDTNPIATTLVADLGPALGRGLLVALALGFTASMIAVETAVSRAIWASARAKELPFSGFLGKLSGPERLPRRVLGLVALISGAFLFIQNANAYTLLISGATAGFFISYSMPVVAFAYARLRGTWSPGPVSMGRAGGVVTWIAAAWIVAETINVSWPRNSYGGIWYLNWGVVVMAAALGAAGYAIQAWVFDPRRRAVEPRIELAEEGQGI